MKEAKRVPEEVEGDDLDCGEGWAVPLRTCFAVALSASMFVAKPPPEICSTLLITAAGAIASSAESD